MKLQPNLRMTQGMTDMEKIYKSGNNKGRAHIETLFHIHSGVTRLLESNVVGTQAHKHAQRSLISIRAHCLLYYCGRVVGTSAVW